MEQTPHNRPYNRPLNPVEIEQQIMRLSNEIAASVSRYSAAYNEYLTKKHAYDLARAHAYMRAHGPVEERKMWVEIETERERAECDAADVAYKHADRQAKALEASLRAQQSVGASVRLMYGVAGRGED